MKYLDKKQQKKFKLLLAKNLIRTNKMIKKN